MTTPMTSEEARKRFVPSLDSPQGCLDELAEVNKEVASIAQAWAANAGELKGKQALYDRLYRAALRGTRAQTDLKVAEREAIAHAAIEQLEGGEGLAERIEQLEGLVEQDKTLFRTLERRSSNAQSILSAMKAEARMAEHTPDLAFTRSNRG